jgi:hypothetical protein
MIVVRVELHSAITGQVTELARMHICNRGDGTTTVGNYKVSTLRGRHRAALDKGVVHRAGEVLGHARLKLHVWNLVARALLAMGYSRGQ